MKRLIIILLLLMAFCFTQADVVYDDQNLIIFTVTNFADLAGFSPKMGDFGVVTGGNIYIYSGSVWIDFGILGSYNLGDELLSDIADFSGNWTLAADFDLATTDFEYNDATHDGTMTQANADFDGTLVASTWYMLRYTLSDATTPVAATSIKASLGTSEIYVELGAVKTYYYLIKSDAVVTGDDFVITVATSSAGDITGDFVSLREVKTSYGVWTNLFVINDLKVEEDLTVDDLLIYDINQSNTLNIEWNEDDTADRVLNFKVNTGDRTVDLSENITIADGYDVTVTAEDATTAIVLDNANLEVEFSDATQRNFKVVSAKAGNIALTLEENLSVSNGYDFTLLAEDTAGSILLDKQTLEIEGEGTATRLFKLINAEDAARTLTYNEDFTTGDGYAITMTADDATTSIVMDNANFETEFSDATKRNLKIVSAKAGDITITLQENISLNNGYDLDMVAEDNATSVVYDNVDVEFESSDASERSWKFTSAKAGNTTVTLEEDFSILDGTDVSIQATGVACDIILTKQDFTVTGEGTALRVLELVNANDAAAKLTIEGTSGIIDQDLTTDTSVEFAGLLSTAAVTVANTTAPDIVIDNTTTGSDVDSGYLTWRGNDGVADTELDMSIFLDVTTTTDYKLSFMDDGKVNEVASIDQSGNFQCDGTATIGALTTGDITISDVDPVLNFKDTDCTDADVNAFIQVDATTTTTNAEDIDMTFMFQVDGTPTNWLVADGDGNIELVSTLDIVLDPTGNNVMPGSDNADALGAVGTSWSDLALGDGSVIDWHNDVTATHSANLITITGGNTRVDRLEIDSASDYIDVSTDMDIVSAADMVLTPTGIEVHIVGGLSVGDETDVGDNNFRTVGNATIGAASPDDVQPIFSIVGDADSDAAGDTSETLALTLTPNADPTLATWGFTNTQCAGYTFDDVVNVANGTAALPAITGTDTDTGIYFGSDQINMSTAGSYKFLISTSNIQSDLDFIPTVNTAMALGSVSRHWTVGYFGDDPANTNWTAMHLLNADDGATGETGQTIDLEFELKGTIDSGSNYTIEEAFKISAIKTADYFHVSDQTDNDSKVEFSPVTDGSYVLAMTLSNDDVTFADDALFATGGVIDWNSTDKLTHSANTMTVSGFTTWDMGAVTTLDFDAAVSITGGEVHFTNNAAAVTFGAVATDADVVLAFDAVTSQGSITFMEDEARFDLVGALLSSSYIQSTGNVVVGGDIRMTNGNFAGINNAERFEFYDAGYIDCIDSYLNIKQDNANAAFTLFNLINTDEQLTTETGQTSDMEFMVQGTIDSGSNFTDEEAFKISVIKTADYFHASDQTDNDSKVEFSPVTNGSYVVALTLEDNDATVADDFDAVGDLTAATITSDAGVSGTTGAFSSTLSAGSTFTQETYVIRKHVAITGAADNAATNFFTITTTDETGDVDGGGYTVNLYVMAGESLANNSTNTAVMSMTCHFGRIMVGAGTGTNSAVAEISQSASAGEGTGAVANVTITVVETSEFVQTVQVTVDINGGTADATAIVELIYSDFTTSPVIAGI